MCTHMKILKHIHNFFIKILNYEQKWLKTSNVDEKFNKNSLKPWMYTLTQKTYKISEIYKKMHEKVYKKVKIFENMIHNT